MGKIKSLFLSCHPVVLQAIMGFIISNPFITMDFEVFINTNELKSRSKDYNVVIIDDGAVRNEELNKIIIDISTVDEVKKIIYTSKTEKKYFNSLTSFGIDGIVSTKEDFSVLGEATIKVYRGEKYICKYVDKTTNNKFIYFDDYIKKLTKREKEIIYLRNNGYGNKDLANELHVSVKTIENHSEHIKEKLGLNSIKELENLKLLPTTPL